MLSPFPLSCPEPWVVLKELPLGNLFLELGNPLWAVCVCVTSVSSGIHVASIQAHVQVGNMPTQRLSFTHHTPSHTLW